MVTLVVFETIITLASATKFTLRRATITCIGKALVTEVWEHHLTSSIAFLTIPFITYTATKVDVLSIYSSPAQITSSPPGSWWTMIHCRIMRLLIISREVARCIRALSSLT